MKETDKQTKPSYDDKLVLAKLLRITEKIPEANVYHKFILNALYNSLNFDIGFETAVAQFTEENYDGLIEFERSGWVESLRRKFSELIFLDRMINVTGMFLFREKIMESHIESLFSSNKQKAIPIEEILKRLTKPPGDRK